MSKIDATEALTVYKAFCKQSDKVVIYLSTARKLHQLLDVPVPNLKHVRSSPRRMPSIGADASVILSPRPRCHSSCVGRVPERPQF